MERIYRKSGWWGPLRWGQEAIATGGWGGAPAQVTAAHGSSSVPCSTHVLGCSLRSGCLPYQLHFVRMVTCLSRAFKSIVWLQTGYLYLTRSQADGQTFPCALNFCTFSTVSTERLDLGFLPRGGTGVIFLIGAGRLALCSDSQVALQKGVCVCFTNASVEMQEGTWFRELIDEITVTNLQAVLGSSPPSLWVAASSAC